MNHRNENFSGAASEGQSTPGNHTHFLELFILTLHSLHTLQYTIVSVGNHYTFWNRSYDGLVKNGPKNEGSYFSVLQRYPESLRQTKLDTL